MVARRFDDCLRTDLPGEQSSRRSFARDRTGFFLNRSGREGGDTLSRPRSLEYLIWRFRERMGLTQNDWESFDYEQQLTCLAYERLREQEQKLP